MSTIPVLTTARLILRAHEAADLDPLYAMRSDPRVARYIGNILLTRPQSWARICSYRGMWPLLGYGYWALEERATGAFIGEAGFADFKREMEPSLEGQPEAGWILSPDASGKGYATEAVQCALDWMDRTFPGRETVCMIDPENAASLRVAAKCGYTRWTDTVYMDDPVTLFRRPGGGAPGVTAEPGG
jgi:RimJ/RimL family protein N-acetyltransferase